MATTAPLEASAPQIHTLVATSLAAFVTGFGLALYTTRGYLVSPAWRAERERNLRDPAESDESDVDEGDSLLDHAPNWANAADADRRQGLRAAAEEKTNKRKDKKKNESSVEEDDGEESQAAAGDGKSEELRDTDSNEECKLVLVVRTDLGMTKGKIAAQCSHATLACYKSLSSRAAASDSDSGSVARALLRRWERLGQAKIALQAPPGGGEDELAALAGRARSLGLTAEVVQDAGRTQIAAGSTTVLGVGPAPRSLVDQVTGGLKLL
ncbi:peptidyl-tRNA hydrolase PTH2-domain-containing protein [Xylariaceae sp. FL0804]|nr:peptidyl-tRNA hydrolase PTH2-domain-containing protein [Xylariaceae sp. FL0804]